VPRQEPPPRDPQQIIEDQAREIERLREDLRRAEAERQRLRRENDALKEELEAARRTASRQAAPFARDTHVAHPRRPGRKAGTAYGRRAYRRAPGHVDETYDAPLPPHCPHCQGAVRHARIATQYQEELPVQRPIVRRFRVHIGRCRQCRRRLQGRHPLQTSDALGAAAVQLGPQTVALAVLLNKRCGLPYGKIAALLRDRFGLTVTRGGLVHAVHRAARQAQPTYDALCETVRGSPVVTPDETGWKVAGTLQWLWTVTTPDTTVYAIQPGRGFSQAATLLGEDFAGVIVRDGWAPYRRFTQAIHQTCLAHLLRRCRLLLADHPRARLVHVVRTLLQQALALRDRYHAGRVTAHGLAVARGHLVNRVNRRLDQPGSVADVQRFASHLAVEFPALFTFLLDPMAIDATNWRAEQALRPAVVTRKVCGGNRSWRGAATQQILASVLRTAHQRQLDAHALMVSMLRDPHPTVSVEFSGRAQ
jgi:transposase